MPLFYLTAYESFCCPHALERRSAVVRSQKGVAAHLSSKQLLFIGFEELNVF